MKHQMAVLGILVSFGVVAATPAVAATVQNQDTTEYEIDVITDAETKTVTIAGGAKLENICGACTLYLIGAEEDVKVAEGDMLVIKDGKIEPAQ